jgi:hypothetical protein
MPSTAPVTMTIDCGMPMGSRRECPQCCRKPVVMKCIRIEGYRCKDEPNRVLILEQLQTEHCTDYVNWRKSTGTLEKMAGIMREAMQPQQLEQLARGDRACTR